MKKFFRQTLSLLIVAATMSITLSSCHSLFHDDLGPCDQGMVIQLVPKYAALKSFETEMTDVRIFIYDAATDTRVSEIDVTADDLVAQNYAVTVSDLPAGEYNVVVWNGLSDAENYDAEEDGGVTLLTNRDHATDNAFQPLWHGMTTDVTVNTLEVTNVTVPMVKDTNNFVVFLCTTTGEILDPDDFDFKITGTNGVMDRTNALLTCPEITYNDFVCRSEKIEGSIDEEIAPNDELGYLHVVRSELNTLRLTTTNPSYLTITQKLTGKNVLTLALNDYILKAFRSDYANRKITDQEYFDTEDLFNLTFFLTPRVADDGSEVYFCAVLRINNWILRFQEFQLT